MQKLLVSVRGKNEALIAVKAGAHIVDVEYPGSALGTPYPLNILTVRRNIPSEVEVSTNIGEEQHSYSSACQAALGVAVAGADIIKTGLAKMSYSTAAKLGRDLVRTVKYRRFGLNKKVIPVIFADPDMVKKYLNPIEYGPKLAKRIHADGILIDTFDKTRGFGLWDYVLLEDIRLFAQHCHNAGLEAWIAGSIKLEQMQYYWDTGVDVICVRGAACELITEKGRFGEVSEDLVRQIVKTIPQT